MIKPGSGRQVTTSERAEQQQQQQQQQQPPSPAKPAQQADDPERAKDFMLLLKQLDPPVTPKSRWSRVCDPSVAALPATRLGLG